MKLWLVVLHIVLVGTNLWVTAHFHEDVSKDNEFAEFEDFEEEKTNSRVEVQPEEEDEFVEPDKDQNFDEEDVLVEDGDSEFDHFQVRNNVAVRKQNIFVFNLLLHKKHLFGKKFLQ